MLKFFQKNTLSNYCISKTQRNSSIELLRIILMAFIIWGHCFSQSALPENLAFSSRVMQVFMGGLARIATSCFMVISVWYIDVDADEHKFIKKAVVLAVQYILLCLILNFCVNLLYDIYTHKIHFGRYLLLLWRSFWVLTWNPLWFITCYIMFLFIVPLLNAALRYVRNKKIEPYALVCALSFFIINTMAPFVIFVFPDENLHEELLAFISMYFIVKICQDKMKRFARSCPWLLLVAGGVYRHLFNKDCKYGLGESGSPYKGFR